MGAQMPADEPARSGDQCLQRLPRESDLIVTLGDGAVVGGSVVAGDVTPKDSTFVGRDQVTIERAETVHVGDQAEAKETERQEWALRAYLERLAAESNVHHLRGMDPRAADVTSQETMSLAAIYTALGTNRNIPADDEWMTDEEWLDQEVINRGQEAHDGPRVFVRDYKVRPMSALEAASCFKGGRRGPHDGGGGFPGWHLAIWHAGYERQYLGMVQQHRVLGSAISLSSR